MTLENTLRQQLSNPEPGGFHVSGDDRKECRAKEHPSEDGEIPFHDAILPSSIRITR